MAEKENKTQSELSGVHQPNAPATLTADQAMGPLPDWADASHDQRVRIIARAALSLLHAGGPQSVTMRAVAGRLNLGTMTLYTYVASQQALQSAMAAEGFAWLDANCMAASTLGSANHWRGGARSYLQFALEHPHIYKMLFDSPISDDEHTQLVFEGAFANFIAFISETVASTEQDADQRQAIALRTGQTYWVALHGLASLAIAGRLHGDLDQLLDDLLDRVAPPVRDDLDVEQIMAMKRSKQMGG
jgi:AcrR family transcriptional regulator